MNDAITRAEALLAAATPGPWRMHDNAVVDANGAIVARGPALTSRMARGQINDAALIAAAPTLLRELIDAVRGRDARIEELKREQPGLFHARCVTERDAAIARAEAAERALAESARPCGVWCPGCAGLAFVDDEGTCTVCGDAGTMPVTEMAETVARIGEIVNATELYEVGELVGHVRSVVEDRDGRPNISRADARHYVAEIDSGGEAARDERVGWFCVDQELRVHAKGE